MVWQFLVALSFTVLCRLTTMVIYDLPILTQQNDLASAPLGSLCVIMLPASFLCDAGVIARSRSCSKLFFCFQIFSLIVLSPPPTLPSVRRPNRPARSAPPSPHSLEENGQAAD
ncbi:hypothetical protein C8F04DRAFT_743256 [Mycena alexandri]|uniref:Uncharacterized protein n=1 Tax=Mycena alexandri TaxID=1745969 RepID=A0AAD6X2M2_9AGAR|nr:hypothetical protein C8F04DRAFT_743256 [Mycena alexandri]